MGRRKSKKGGETETPSANNMRSLVFMAGVAAVFLAVLYFYTRSPVPDRPHVDPASPLVETRPVLSPDLFFGDAALAYKYAAEIPKVIDSQFCYCYCKKDHGHKTLLTCFTNKHGSKCELCIEEVLYAYELHKKGKSIDEIIVEIDKRFFKPYKPQHL